MFWWRAKRNERTKSEDPEKKLSHRSIFVTLSHAIRPKEWMVRVKMKQMMKHQEA
jgi:hypothetical protein